MPSPTPVIDPALLNEPRIGAFLAAVREDAPGLCHVADDRVVALAYAALDLLHNDGEAGVERVFTRGMIHGFARDDIDTLLGAAVLHITGPAFAAQALSHEAEANSKGLLQ